MNPFADSSELIRLIESAAKEHHQLLAIVKLHRGYAELRKFADEIAKLIDGEIIRSVYTPNSELLLFEIRRKELALVLLIMKSDTEEIVTVEQISNHEIAEIESNIYSSNINDIYIRLVSDIF